MEKTRLFSVETLDKARHAISLYTIRELCTMFGCGRAHIDMALNNGSLKFMSPNNRDRFIYLNDFLEFFTKTKEQKEEGGEEC